MNRGAWAAVFSKPIAGGPVTHGFDEYFGTDVPNWPPFCFIENQRTVGIPSEYTCRPTYSRNEKARRFRRLQVCEDSGYDPVGLSRC